MHLTLESFLFLKQGQEIHLLQLGISGNLSDDGLGQKIGKMR